MVQNYIVEYQPTGDYSFTLKPINENYLMAVIFRREDKVAYGKLKYNDGTWIMSKQEATRILRRAQKEHQNNTRFIAPIRVG